MIQIVAVIVTNPGLRAEILQAFKDNAPAVRAEKGCVSYEAFVDLPIFGPAQTLYGEDAFVAIEMWADADAIKAHAKAPHMAAFEEKLKGKVVSRAIHLLKPA